MTVIAWDGYVLGADRRLSMHNIEADKVFKLSDGTYFACAGDYMECQKVRKWLESKLPVEKRGTINDVSVLHINKDGTCEAWHACMAGPGQPNIQPPYALGSGREYAMGALGHGATVREAIEITVRYCNSCGGTPDIEEVPTHPSLRK